MDEYRCSICGRLVILKLDLDAYRPSGWELPPVCYTVRGECEQGHEKEVITGEMGIATMNEHNRAARAEAVT